MRKYSASESRLKCLTSEWFYRILQPIAHTKLTPHATDYRLLDRNVISVFSKLTERNRITRGLIDWLGFRRDYIHFTAPPRLHGEAAYTYRKLVALAMNSLTSYSLVPLKLAGYLGILILSLSVPTGLFIYFEQYVFGDRLNLNISGTGMLGLILLILVGVMLVCLGLVALYIARIHAEVVNRPLYVVRREFQVPGAGIPESTEALGAMQSIPQEAHAPKATVGLEGATE